MKNAFTVRSVQMHPDFQSALTGARFDQPRQ
jgi:hypothetical protein